MLGRYKDAIADLRRALDREPGDASVPVNLGVALGNLQRSDEALATLGKAVAIDPDDAYAHHNLGNVLADAGRTEEAKNQYRRAMALDPEQPRPHEQMARILFIEGDRDATTAHLETAVRLAPDDPVTRMARGAAYESMGRHDDASQAYRAVLEVDAGLLQAGLLLGRALRNAGKPAEAVAALEPVVARDDHDPDAHYLLGLAYLDNRQSDKAREQLATYIEADPAGQHADEVRGVLETLDE